MSFYPISAQRGIVYVPSFAVERFFSAAGLLTTFPKTYLERIAEPEPLCSSDPPPSPRTFCRRFDHAYQRAQEIVREEDKNLSPVMIPPGTGLPAPLYSAYAGAIELLHKRDLILCHFFEKFLEAHELEFPSFMQENLSIPEKAKRIQEDIKEKQYELTTLWEKNGPPFKKIPPEAVLYLQMSDENLKGLYRHCRESYHIPGTMRSEVLFAFVESGKFTRIDNFWDHFPFRIVEEAIRIHRNAVVKAYLENSDIRDCVNLKSWKVVAQRAKNQEAVLLIEQKYTQVLSQRTRVDRCCFLFGQNCGAWSDEIYGDREAGVFTRERVFHFPPLPAEHTEEQNQKLIQFFEKYLKLHHRPIPLFMREQDLATKANDIRKAMQNLTLEYDLKDHWTVFPPEIASLRMDDEIFTNALNFLHANDHDEALFALIESGKLEFFASLRFAPSWFSFGVTSWLDKDRKKLLKEILAKAKQQNRTESVKILRWVLRKKG